MDLKQAINELEKRTKQALETEVAEKVKNIEVEEIQKNVFDVYNNPVMYVRRMSNGIDDKENMIVTVTSDNGSIDFAMTNITKGKDKPIELAELIEHGHGYNGVDYDYPFSKNQEPAFLNPRPFTTKTQEEVNNKGLGIIKTALKNQGLDVK